MATEQEGVRLIIKSNFDKTDVLLWATLPNGNKWKDGACYKADSAKDMRKCKRTLLTRYNIACDMAKTEKETGDEEMSKM